MELHQEGNVVESTRWSNKESLGGMSGIACWLLALFKMCKLVPQDIGCSNTLPIWPHTSISACFGTPLLLAPLIVSLSVLKSCKKSLSTEPTYAQHLQQEVVFKTFLAKSAMLQYPNNTQIWRGKPDEGRRSLFIPKIDGFH